MCDCMFFRSVHQVTNPLQYWTRHYELPKRSIYQMASSTRFSGDRKQMTDLKAQSKRLPPTLLDSVTICRSDMTVHLTSLCLGYIQ